MSTGSKGDAKDLVDALSLEARTGHGIHEGVAGDAARATLRWLAAASDWGERVSRQRTERYFWAVVRRRALAGDRRVRSYRDRCVATTLAADMLAAGHGRDEVFAQVSRALGRGSAEDWAASAA